VGRQGEPERELLGARAHLAPGLPQDVDELAAGILRVLRREGLNLALEEHEDRRVLERLGPGVGLEARLGDPRRGVLCPVGGQAGLEEQLPRALGLLKVEGPAPCEVPGLPGGERAARNPPAFQVLASGCETQRVVRVGRDPGDLGLHTVGIGELGRAPVGGAAGVGVVRRVDECARPRGRLHATASRPRGPLPRRRRPRRPPGAGSRPPGPGR